MTYSTMFHLISAKDFILSPVTAIRRAFDEIQDQLQRLEDQLQHLQKITEKRRKDQANGGTYGEDYSNNKFSQEAIKQGRSGYKSPDELDATMNELIAVHSAIRHRFSGLRRQPYYTAFLPLFSMASELSDLQIDCLNLADDIATTTCCIRFAEDAYKSDSVTLLQELFAVQSEESSKTPTRTTFTHATTAEDGRAPVEVEGWTADSEEMNMTYDEHTGSSQVQDPLMVACNTTPESQPTDMKAVVLEL